MGAANQRSLRQGRTVRVRMRTNLGDLDVDVFADRAPIAAGQFLAFGQRNPDGLGVAAFGQVVEGMDGVRAIHRMAAAEDPHDATRSQTLRIPVVIESARIGVAI